MGDTSRDPIDHNRTARTHAGESMKDSWRNPGIILVALGIVAFVTCLVAFAWAKVGVGVMAVAVALLAVGAGLAWLAMEGRRVRQVERERLFTHRLVDHRSGIGS